MTDDRPRPSLGIVGGTGPQGRGLAARWAMAGHHVLIGSRTEEKALAAVEDVVGRVSDEVAARVGGAANLEVAERSEIVVVALPHTAQQPTLPSLADACDGKIVVNVVNPMAFDDRGAHAVPVEAGSAAEECAELLPGAVVVSAFHDVSSKRLLRVDESIDTHVLICGDDREACHQVAHLAAHIDGMWGVYCGPLRNSKAIEDLTPVLLHINKTYRIQAGFLIDGIPRNEDSLHAHRADRQG